MKTLTSLLAAIALMGPFSSALAAAAGAGAGADAPPVASSDIGYKTVAEALAAVTKRPGAEVAQPEGWTIVTLRAPDYEIWSFTPPGHYAYPAAVRRTVIEKDGGLYMNMAALCQAAKGPCDRLMAEFKQLNEKAQEEIQRRRAK